MKSTERIIKDIRYYEIKPKDFTGDFNGIIGNVYQITNGTNSPLGAQSKNAAQRHRTTFCHGRMVRLNTH
jgi:hypothetical protein